MITIECVAVPDLPNSQVSSGLAQQMFTQAANAAIAYDLSTIPPNVQRVITIGDSSFSPLADNFDQAIMFPTDPVGPRNAVSDFTLFVYGTSLGPEAIATYSRSILLTNQPTCVYRTYLGVDYAVTPIAYQICPTFRTIQFPNLDFAGLPSMGGNYGPASGGLSYIAVNPAGISTSVCAPPP